MKKAKNYSFAAIIVISILLLTLSCAERRQAKTKSEIELGKTTKTGTKTKKQPNAVELALKFSTHNSTIYKSTVEATRQATWEGLPEKKPSSFKGGRSGSKIEMIFDQYIQSVNDNGNAVAKITIKELKCRTQVTDNIILDFDSSKKDDMKGPLGMLIGESYSIEITPSGQVSKIIDVNDIVAAVSDGSPAGKTAFQLLSVNAIKARHTIPGLPDEQKKISVGQSWDDTKSFYFDQMGAKSYGKTYTLEEIKKVNNNPIAVIQMNAIPSVEDAEQLYKEQSTLPFPFDTTETYSGQTKLNLAEGKVEQCSEKLLIEWIIIDPDSASDEMPDAIKMSALQSNSIERKD
jgi:hypothetical protein